MPPTDADVIAHAERVLANVKGVAPFEALARAIESLLFILTRTASEDVEAQAAWLDEIVAEHEADEYPALAEKYAQIAATLRRLDAEVTWQESRIVDLCAALARRDRVDAEVRGALEKAVSLLWEHCEGLAPRIEPLEAILDAAQPAEPRTPDEDERPDYGRGSDYSHCLSAKDGECNWRHCPQLRDNEPYATGRHCPLDNWSADNE